jgi:hypothetical protein
MSESGTPAVTVTTAGSGAAPAAPDSPLADLRARRQRQIDQLYLDLKVPRWDDDGGPPIWVRYSPMDPGKSDEINGRREELRKADGKEWFTNANADLLIDSVVGVYAKDGDATYSLRIGDPNGEWTKFDPDLAASLGIETSRARDVVLALYLTKGDLVTASLQLADWSGAVSVQADEENRGN